MTRRRSSAPRRHLVIMLKEPHPGQVKTRLGKDIGMGAAAWWYRHQVAGLLRRVYQPDRWQLWLAVSPDIEGLKSRVWPAQVCRVAQGHGNLGDRMARIFKRMPCGPVLIAGSDIPDIDQSQIATAFAKLQPTRAVIGPANDGGYWLIGLARHSTPIPSKIFQNVRWSGPHARQDTIASLGSLRVTQLDRLRDIDTGEDLRQLRGDGGVVQQ